MQTTMALSTTETEYMALSAAYCKMSKEWNQRLPAKYLKKTQEPLSWQNCVSYIQGQSNTIIFTYGRFEDLMVGNHT